MLNCSAGRKLDRIMSALLWQTLIIIIIIGKVAGLNRRCHSMYILKILLETN